MNYSLRTYAPRPARSTTFALLFAALAVLAGASTPLVAHATLRCAVPDNGGGSGNLPPQCEPSYGCPDGVFTLGAVFASGSITNYLGTIRLHGLVATTHGTGGGLGGTFDEFTGTVALTISGGGYFRTVEIPVSLGMRTARSA